MNRDSKSTVLVYFGVLVVIVFFMFFFHFNAIHINKDWQRTTGVVTGVQEYYSSGGRYSSGGWHHRVYVTYPANGRSYNSSVDFSGYDTGVYKTGDECEILYNPNNVTACTIGEVNVNFNTYVPLFLAVPLFVGAVGVALGNKKRKF